MNEERLFTCLSSGRCPHAFLIAGAAGAGKRALARRMAACYIAGEPDESLLINNPNYRELGEVPARAEEVRALAAGANLTGFNDGKRAYLIIEAHRMAAQSQNALLKTLEEPPKNVLFLLTGTELGLLSTVRSRCAILRMGAARSEDIRRTLMAEGADEPAAALAASLSGGVIGLARLYVQTAYQSFRTECVRCLEETLFGVPPFAACAKLAGSELFLHEGAEAKKSDGEAAKAVLNVFSSLLRDALLLGLGAEQPANIDLRSVVSKISNRFTISEIQGMITEMDKAEQKLSFRANPVFTLDAALVRLSEYKEKHA